MSVKWLKILKLVCMEAQAMWVILRRDSVAAGDDADAPHEKTITVPDGSGIEAIIITVAKSGYLASISGGKATWSATSNIPLAVVAQEWEQPRMVSAFPVDWKQLNWERDVLRLYFTYYAQLDPQLVYETLRRWVQSAGNGKGASVRAPY
jgi:hypothetical protein